MIESNKQPLTQESFCELVRNAYDLPPDATLNLLAPLKDDVNWNSFNIVLIMANVESNFGIQIDENSLWECENLEKVFSLLQTKVGK